MKRPIIPGVLLIVAVLVWYRWSAPQQRAAQTEPAANAASPSTSSSGLGVAPITDKPPISSTVGGIAPTTVTAPKTPAQIYATSQNFAADYQQLLASAEPDAPYFAAELLGACRAIYDPSTGQFIELEGELAIRLTALGDRTANARRTLIERCSGWVGQLPMGREVRELRTKAALNNSLVGKSWLLQSLLEQGKSEEASAIASEVLRKQDGNALLMLAPIFVNGSETWRIGPNGEGVPSTLVEPVLTLASCEFGQSCDSDSNQLVFTCATIGYCPRTLREFVLSNPSLLPQEPEQITHYRDVVVAAIRSGRLDLLGLPSPGR